MPSLAKQFVKEMERRILVGEWKIGDNIPPLRTLAEEFHVSRSVINAGIVELCNAGYLTTVPRKHIYVADWKKTGKFAILGGLLENGLYDANFFDNLLEGRMTVEKAIAYRASKARTEEDLAHIKAIVEKEKLCDDAQKLAEADIEFHHALADASHNLVFSLILNSFDDVGNKLTRKFYGKDIDRTFILTMHEKLYMSVQNGDGTEAAKIMEELLSNGESVLKTNK